MTPTPRPNFKYLHILLSGNQKKRIPLIIAGYINCPALQTIPCKIGPIHFRISNRVTFGIPEAKIEIDELKIQ